MCDHEDQHQTTVIATGSIMTEREQQKRTRAVSCEEHEVRLLELQFAREEAAAGMVTALAMTVIMVVTDLIVTDWMTVTRMVRI